MSALGDLFGSLGFGGGGGMLTLLLYMFLGIVGLAATFALFYWLYYRKKRWFLDLEVKIPRSDGRLITAEWAKGSYDARKGVVLVKRKGKRAVPCKPFDIKKYLQGDKILTVVQVGIEDYRPVLLESYLEMVDDETGEEAAIIKTKVDTSESKSWKSTFERETKLAYNIQSLIDKYGHYIGFGILFFMIFVGFAILYGRIT